MVMFMIDTPRVESTIDPNHNMVSFVEALKDKYVDQEIYDDQYFLPKDKMISTGITLVGLGKISTIQRQLRTLVNIDLSGRKINDVGDLRELDGSLENVRVLNISNNQLSWTMIVSLLKFLPRLRDLIVTSNSLNGLDDLNHFPSKSLHSLVMGRTCGDWDDIVKTLSILWTSVEQLDLWDSQLTCDKMKLTTSDAMQSSFVKNLKCLRLSHNHLSNIDWLFDVGSLSNLVELDLSHCHLTTIRMNDGVPAQLNALTTLNISFNDLSDWTEISQLCKLKNLTNLICHENPFFILSKFSRSLVIARIGSMKSLNRQEVTRDSRRDSEILYLRQIYSEYKKFQKGNDPDFEVRHPRFSELAHRYGLPEDPNAKETVNRYLEINLFFEDRELTKKFPRELRVADLRFISRKLFKIQMSTPLSIYCCSADKNGKEIRYELDQDGQTLHYFSVEDGQRIEIMKQ